jgi:hypothetical protein
VTLPGDSIIYHHSQVHFAPTHSLQISVFNPVARKSVQIYPPKPYQPVRRAFIERVAAEYKQRGEPWFANNNHHMNPEMFDSHIMDKIAIDGASKSISFRVQYGEPDNARDPLPFSEMIMVTCAPIDNIETLKCVERALAN